MFFVPVGFTVPTFGLIVISWALLISHFRVIRPPLEITAGLRSNWLIIGASGDGVTTGTAGVASLVLLLVEGVVLSRAVELDDMALLSALLSGVDDEAHPG